jgi:hypothetical protein
VSELADKLRLQIEERHAKALEALQVLTDYLDDPSLLNGTSTAIDNTPAPAPAQLPVRRRGRNAGGSFRSRVLAVITTEWATIGAVAERTGLEVRQVRGVISAPSLARMLERRNSVNGLEYHLRPGMEN